MAGPLFLCGICNEEADNEERQPVQLPACGHSFCRMCLIKTRIRAKQFKCPFCRTPHRGVEPKELPVNYAILEMMRSNEINSNENNFPCEASSSDGSFFDYNYPEKNQSTSPNSTTDEDEADSSDDDQSHDRNFIHLGLAGAVVATAVLAEAGKQGIEGAVKSLKEGCFSLVGTVQETAGNILLFTSLGSAFSFATIMMSSAFITNNYVPSLSMDASLQSIGAADYLAASSGIGGGPVAALRAAGVTDLEITVGVILVSAAYFVVTVAVAVTIVIAEAVAAMGSNGDLKQHKRSDCDHADDNKSDDRPRLIKRQEDSSKEDDRQKNGTDVDINDANKKKIDNKVGSNRDTYNGDIINEEGREAGPRNYGVGRRQRRIIYLHEI